MELKPCPFCGATGHAYKFEYPNGDVTWRVAIFHENTCYLDDPNNFERKEDIVNAWNRRSGNEDY